ncbi:MAG: hypothetical protein GXY83_43670 [Rhodopirellula sp.]|nr:hypothetical protein [Rhodopirellula sp.]
MSSPEHEKRVAALEKELAQLKRKIEATEPAEPWCERIANTFENDPVYEKATKLGRQYRESLTPGKSSRKGN